MSRQAITISQINGVTNVIADSHISYENQLLSAKNIINTLSTSSGSGPSVTVEVWENFATKRYTTVHGVGVVSTTSQRKSISYSTAPVMTNTTLSAIGVSAFGTTGTASLYMGGVVNLTSAITITGLGRWVIAGNSQSHIVKLVNNSGVDVSGVSVTIDTAGATSGAFKYASLAAPIFVPAGSYFLVSKEFAGGDSYYQYNGGTHVIQNGSVSIGGGVYSSGGYVAPYTQQPSANNMYGPLDIKYNSVNKIYLSASGALGTGDGSSSANSADASTQAALDAIYAKYIMYNGSINPGDKGAVTYFYYGPGTYQTLGRKYQTRCTVNGGNYHIGSGVDKTIIQLVGASDATGDGLIFSRDLVVTPLINWGIWDVTLDVNGANQPKMQNGGAGGAVGGINLPAGNNITIQRVKIKGFGAKSGYECFPIIVNANSGQTLLMTNVLMDSCIVTEPMPGNTDGCSCLVISDNATVTIDNSCIISNCSILNVFTDGGFTYCHSYGAPTCINNFTLNGDVCYYLEPNWQQFTGICAIVKGNIGIGVNRGAYVLCHSSAGINNIAITDEYYLMNSSVNSIAIRLTGLGASPKCTFGNVLIRNNIISKPYGGLGEGIVFNEAASQSMTINNLVLDGNIFYGGYTSANSVSLDSHNTVLPSVVRIQSDQLN